jgi:hypothetical protein
MKFQDGSIYQGLSK